MNKPVKSCKSRKSLVDVLQEIYDEASHIIGTEGNHKEIAMEDAKSIKKLAKEGLSICSHKAKG